MIAPERALRGRETAVSVADRHAVLAAPLKDWAGIGPDGLQQLVLGMGCFWGAEKTFWQVPGVFTTAVGYAGGYTPNPSYEEVCSGSTGQTEVVLVVYDPARVSTEEILRVFWENHDPTQGMRQGNDVGTQYRSAILYSTDEQRAVAEATRAAFQERLTAAGYGEITTEIAPASDWPFYYAEDYHQQYLQKNPWGYCPDHGTGVSCPVGLDLGAPPAQVDAPPPRSAPAV